MINTKKKKKMIKRIILKSDRIRKRSEKTRIIIMI